MNYQLVVTMAFGPIGTEAPRGGALRQRERERKTRDGCPQQRRTTAVGYHEPEISCPGGPCLVVHPTTVGTCP